MGTEQLREASDPQPALTAGAPTEQQRQLFDFEGSANLLVGQGADSATVPFVRGLVNRGELPFVKIGKKFFIRRVDLEQWVERHARRRRA